MWDRYEFKVGDKVARADGVWAEVLSAEDGAALRVRYTGEGGDPSAAGTQDTVMVDEVASFSPAPAGPGWEERVAVAVYPVPETEESEGGFEAVTTGGVPLGVSVTAFENTASEALDRLFGALRAFGFAGTATVVDSTYMGGAKRYEAEV